MKSLFTLLLTLCLLFSSSKAPVNTPMQNPYTPEKAICPEEPTVILPNELSIPKEPVYEETEEPPLDAFSSCTLSVEANTLGVPYILPPSQVMLFADENAAQIMERFFEMTGIETTYGGSLESGYYLQGLSALPPFEVNISQDETDLCEANGFTVDPTLYTSSALSEFDFTAGSGFLYLVNGETPDVGMSDYIPMDGDRITIVFTLCYGEDLN